MAIQREAATAQQIGGRLGSNPGGVYRGADGVRRYVKFYKDPGQAYSEAVANRAYRMMNIRTPVSTLVIDKGDRVAGVANEWIDNLGTLGELALSGPLSRTHAWDILQGFVADVWLANWDAVGTGLDNVVVFKRLNDMKIARLDQGGALLFRAKAGRKATVQGDQAASVGKALGKITEWDGFADAATNPCYAGIFEAAGLSDASELGRKALSQIEDVRRLGDRTDDFEDLVFGCGGISGVAEEDRLAIVKMMQDRARALETEIAPRIEKAMGVALEKK